MLFLIRQTHTIHRRDWNQKDGKVVSCKNYPKESYYHYVIKSRLMKNEEEKVTDDMILYIEKS